MQEIMDPMVDRLVSTTDQLGHLKDEQNKAGKRVQDLKDTIFNTGDKLDVFEQIHERMNKIDAERMSLAEQVKYENT